MPKKRKAGRPVTTGSDSNPLIAFRVGKAGLAVLKAEAERLGLSSPSMAAKRRTWPDGEPT